MGGKLLARRVLAPMTVLALVFAAGPIAQAQAPGGPGTHSQGQINAAIGRAVAFLARSQNADGSISLSYPTAETGLSLAAYGVSSSSHWSRLTPRLRRSALRALRFLLAQQGSNGAFTGDSATYDTGIALTALGLLGPVPGHRGQVARAIHRARIYLLRTQQGPRSVTGSRSRPASDTCQSTGADGRGRGGQSFCGGWNYDSDFGRSDESNTGFALTGLRFTGGVPRAAARLNIGWQRHVEEYSGNSFATRHDGGGSYQPGSNDGNESSNANDAGSLVFGYAYDHVRQSDRAVAGAIAFAHDVLREYERMKHAERVMVFHTGNRRDGTCQIGRGRCDWQFADGEGGYHYSMFALSKGLGSYEHASLSDPNNFYAQIADLLLTQQRSNGHWPADLRDDASNVGATAFAVLALGVSHAASSAPPATVAPQFTG